jgi:membrane fusion protein (multidrug efflux system)
MNRVQGIPRRGTAVFPALLLVLLVLGGCEQTKSSAQPQEQEQERHERAVQVSIEEVRPGPIRDVLILPGRTEAWEDVRVPSDTVGKVEWIGPEEGDAVKKGELIAKVDVSSLEAALDQAQAAFDLADEVYRRRAELFEKKLIAKEELDRSRTERSVAEGDLKRARVEHRRGFTYAPIGGVVNHLYVDQGEFIGRGDPLADIVNVDRIEVDVDVPEMDVRFLEKGQDALVRIDAFPEERIPGKVDFVAYKADPATKTFMVKVIIPNPERRIRPGMIARAAFLKRVIPDALTAPLFALVNKSGERILYVEEEGVVRARTVDIGVIEGERVQITRGLEPGDHLIVKGQKEVEEGMRVEVK